jgi:hypothetical protein
VVPPHAGHRVDRRVVLLRVAQQRGPAARPRRRRPRRGRRPVGGPRRRVLPGPEVRRRAAQAPGAPALVPVGGVPDLVVGVLPAGAPLLVDGRHHDGGPGGGGAGAVAGGVDRRGDAGRRLVVLRRRLQERPRQAPGGAGGAAGGVRGGRGLRPVPAPVAARGVPARGRDARDVDGGERVVRDHPGPARDGRRDGRRHGAAGGAGQGGRAALAAQQLLHAAGVVRHGLGPLPEHVRQRARLAGVVGGGWRRSGGASRPQRGREGDADALAVAARGGLVGGGRRWWRGRRGRRWPTTGWRGPR